MSEAKQQPEAIKGHCPRCGPEKWADIVAKYDKHIENEEAGVWWDKTYRILQCRGCEAVYFQTEGTFSEDLEYKQDPITGETEGYIPAEIKYWPAPSKRQKPDWLWQLATTDDGLHSLLESVYVALDNDLPVLAAIGIRTTFDRASELLGVDQSKTFAQKLEDLHSSGKIGSDEKRTFDILTDAGSAAAHRGWTPKPDELNTMMALIEAFLYRAFILDAAVRELVVPPKKKP